MAPLEDVFNANNKNLMNCRCEILISIQHYKDKPKKKSMANTEKLDDFGDFERHELSVITFTSNTSYNTSSLRAK